jgi:hypothetical protein
VFEFQLFRSFIVNRSDGGRRETGLHSELKKLPYLALVRSNALWAVLMLDTPRVDLTMKFLLKVYPPDHLVTLIWTDGLPAYKTQSKAMALKNLAREYGEAKFFASLYVPPMR